MRRELDLFDAATHPRPADRVSLPDYWQTVVRDAVDAHVSAFREQLPDKVTRNLISNSSLDDKAVSAIRDAASRRLNEVLRNP